MGFRVELAEVDAALRAALGTESVVAVSYPPGPSAEAVFAFAVPVDRDGDEIVVRLIGIDTPETVAQDRPIECFGPEASARTAQLVEGKQVWLEYDEVSGMTDKYDRTLAYVWLTTDLMLNEQLVREGFAEEYTYSEGARYQAQMVQAEGEARASRAGLWSAC